MVLESFNIYDDDSEITGEIARFVDIELKTAGKAYLEYKRIEGEYGPDAATYWSWKVKGDEMSGLIHKASEQIISKDSVEKAISCKFSVPVDAERDKAILQDYLRKLKVYFDNINKGKFTERFKNAMAWLGGLVICLVIFRFAAKIGGYTV